VRIRSLALAGAAVLLAGCGTAGSAAIVGPQVISDQALQGQVQVVLEAQARPASTVDPDLSRQILNRLVLTALVEQLADRENVTVDQGTIDETLLNFDAQVGGRAQLEALYLEQGVAPSQIEDVIRLNALAVNVGIALDPSGTPDSQGQLLVQAITDLGLELGTEVSPRFGAWEPMVLNIGPVIDDLSVPAQ
jgi:SurA N-terminal domain